MSKKYFIFYIIFFIQHTFGSTCFKSTLRNQNIKCKIGIGLISMNLIISTANCIFCVTKNCKNDTLKNIFFRHYFLFVRHSQQKGYTIGYIFNKECYQKMSTVSILRNFVCCTPLLSVLGSILAYANYEK